MKKLLLLTVFIQYISPLWAQKPPVDTAAFFNWPTIQDWPYPAISNNGKYAMYSVKHIPKGSSTMMVHALNSDWKIGLPGVQKAAFTDDSRQLIFMLPQDSLCLFTLATEEKAYIPKVKSFQLFMQEGNEWMACQMDTKALLLRNLANGIQRAYENVDSYVLSEDGATLILKTVPDTAKGISLQWLDLSNGQVKEIWKGNDANDIRLDEAGKQLAFLSPDLDTTGKAIWLYKTGEEKAVALVNDQAPAMPENMELAGIDAFSKDGSKLFLQIKQKPAVQKIPGLVPVNIWSYKDVKLQSQQLSELKAGAPAYLAAIDIQRPFSIQRIQQEHEKVNSRSDHWMLLNYGEGDVSEQYWNQAAEETTYLVSVNNGKRKPILVRRGTASPNGRYIIGYGTDEIWGSDLYIYDIATGIARNITSNIPVSPQDGENNILLTKESRVFRLAGWFPKDTGLLVYDNYDIWQIDPTGKKSAVNLTRGQNKNWQFRLVHENVFGRILVQPAQPLLLKAFNTFTKKSGFYKLTLSNKAEPELLFAGNYAFEMFPTLKGRSYFLKARDTNVYLVKREQTDKSPNIFSTVDFRTFLPISGEYPEKSVNWAVSELINFTTLDGFPIQAILYKPENFDAHKKYPLIIHYYEKKSDELNLYRSPVVPNGGALDIAWFVSHGYLVLLTDIHHKIGDSGKSIYNAVVGAAKYLSGRPYIDKYHIGIQGHSFGGYETNYLITHSDLFAAAVSSSGVSDLISSHGTLWFGGIARHEYVERRGYRMGSPPWQNPSLYIKHTPIFHVKDITTPILLMNNKKDFNVRFEQGLEFFLALRRAGKRVWMLEYDNGGHGVWGEEYKDYLLRMTQFFDHYLKGAPPPKWMTQGIPASRKGMETGFELDYTVKTPGPGLLIEKEKKATAKGQTAIQAKEKEASGQ